MSLYPPLCEVLDRDKKFCLPAGLLCCPVRETVPVLFSCNTCAVDTLDELALQYKIHDKQW
jgi:hypothetical protein